MADEVHRRGQVMDVKELYAELLEGVQFGLQLSRGEILDYSSPPSAW
jgi:hypothetical protein